MLPSVPMTPEPPAGPIVIAAELVDRLLRGEVLTRAGVASQYRLPRHVSQRVIKIARNTLFVEHGAILPIPRRADEYELAISSDRRKIFGGEMQPTLAIRATVNHYAERFDREAAHSKTPRIASKMSGALDYQAKALSAMTEAIEAFIENELV